MKKQETTERLENILKNVKSQKDTEEYLVEHTGGGYSTFSSYMNEYIGTNSISVPDMIKRSNINRNYVYNILNGNRNPGRDKIIALCVGAGMNCKEINRGLKIAQEGVLYAKNERDAIIMISVNRGIKDVLQINLLLDEKGFNILG